MVVSLYSSGMPLPSKSAGTDARGPHYGSGALCCLVRRGSDGEAAPTQRGRATGVRVATTARACPLRPSMPSLVSGVLRCSLPTVLKGRGRPAFDAISQPLKAALNRLDSDAQVGTDMMRLVHNLSAAVRGMQVDIRFVVDVRANPPQHGFLVAKNLSPLDLPHPACA